MLRSVANPQAMAQARQPARPLARRPLGHDVTDRLEGAGYGALAGLFSPLFFGVEAAFDAHRARSAQDYGWIALKGVGALLCAAALPLMVGGGALCGAYVGAKRLAAEAADLGASEHHSNTCEIAAWRGPLAPNAPRRGAELRRAETTRLRRGLPKQSSD